MSNVEVVFTSKFVIGYSTFNIFIPRRGTFFFSCHNSNFTTMTKKKICLAATVGILLHVHTTYAQTDSTKNKTINVPVRIGIAPGFSTQGHKDVHTTSNVSLNIYGGMTGSINGIE